MFKGKQSRNGRGRGRGDIFLKIENSSDRKADRERAENQIRNIAGLGSRRADRSSLCADFEKNWACWGKTFLLPPLREAAMIARSLCADRKRGRGARDKGRKGASVKETLTAGVKRTRPRCLAPPVRLSMRSLLLCAIYFPCLSSIYLDIYKRYMI